MNKLNTTTLSDEQAIGIAVRAIVDDLRAVVADHADSGMTRRLIRHGLTEVLGEELVRGLDEHPSVRTECMQLVTALGLRIMPTGDRAC